MKKRKKNYYKTYFESNWNNAKIIWKFIKSIMTLKNITYSVPRTISQGENLITNPNDIATIFNNYFSSVAGTAKENIKASFPLDDLKERRVSKINTVFFSNGTSFW